VIVAAQAEKNAACEGGAVEPALRLQAGSGALLTTRITPSDCSTSGIVAIAVPRFSSVMAMPPSRFVAVSVPPESAPGLSSVATVPAGSAANASSVGAKTVNGPLPFSVSTSPAASIAATSVVWSEESTATVLEDGRVQD